MTGWEASVLAANVTEVSWVGKIVFFASFLCLHCLRREAQVKIDFKTWGSVFTAGLTGVTGTECKTFVKDFQNQKLPSWLVLSFNLLLLGSQLCGDHLRDHDAEPLDARLLQPTRPTVSGTWGFQSKSSRLKEIPPPLLIETVSALPTILRLVPVLATAASPAPLGSILFLHIRFIFIKDYLARFLLFKSGSGVSEVGWSRT